MNTLFCSFPRRLICDALNVDLGIKSCSGTPIYAILWFKGAGIESPYMASPGTRFVQPGKIEIDANERVVFGNVEAAFSFASSSILSLTICPFL